MSIRGSYSPPSLLFSCLSCFSWFHSRISWFHSWFKLSPLLSFSCLSCFSWFHSCISWFHSCPFVSIRGSYSPPPPFFFVPFVVPHLYFVIPFVVPFVVHTLPPSLLFSCLSCFSWFHSCISWFHSCPFVSIRGSYSPPLHFIFVYFVFFVVPLLYFVVPFVAQSSGVGVFLSYRRRASPLRCQVILTECGRRRAAAPIISGRKVQTPQGRKPG